MKRRLLVVLVVAQALAWMALALGRIEECSQDCQKECRRFGLYRCRCGRICPFDAKTDGRGIPRLEGRAARSNPGR
jgi:hypothetical protein